jgi:hypothetical protein
MKNNKTIMLLLAAGVAYWYYKQYLKNKATGLPQYEDVKIKEDMAIQTALNMPNVPTIEVAEKRLRPLAYQPDVVPEIDSYNVKYTMSGYRKLGKVPNSI